MGPTNIKHLDPFWSNFSIKINAMPDEIHVGTVGTLCVPTAPTMVQKYLHPGPP